MNRPQNGKVRRVFRKQLVKQLVGDIRNYNKRRSQTNTEVEQRLDGKLHLLFPLEDRKLKDCAVCSDRGQNGSRKRSKFICDTCESKPGLCIGLCFKKYHTEKNFKN